MLYKSRSQKSFQRAGASLKKSAHRILKLEEIQASVEDATWRSPLDAGRLEEEESSSCSVRRQLADGSTSAIAMASATAQNSTADRAKVIVGADRLQTVPDTAAVTANAAGTNGHSTGLADPLGCSTTC